MAGRLPWDVPVAPVTGSVADLRDVTHRVVAPGVVLPGVVALRLMTGRVGVRTVLAGVTPLADPDGTPGGARDVALDVALLALGRPVPVLVTGTPLQRRVLEELARVPAGSVVTYGQLAARAGAPGAARAAARVMATNAVPLVLPCHRAVPAGRGIGTYGWGSDVKAALLALEGALPAAAGEGSP